MMRPKWEQHVWGDKQYTGGYWEHFVNPTAEVKTERKQTTGGRRGKVNGMQQRDRSAQGERGERSASWEFPQQLKLCFIREESFVRGSLLHGPVRLGVGSTGEELRALPPVLPSEPAGTSVSLWFESSVLLGEQDGRGSMELQRRNAH